MTVRGIGVFFLGAFLVEVMGATLSVIAGAPGVERLDYVGGSLMLFGWVAGGVIAVQIWRRRRAPMLGTCPHCAEPIDAQAVACGFCGHSVEQAGVAERLDVAGVAAGSVEPTPASSAIVAVAPAEIGKPTEEIAARAAARTVQAAPAERASSGTATKPTLLGMGIGFMVAVGIAVVMFDIYFPNSDTEPLTLGELFLGLGLAFGLPLLGAAAGGIIGGRVFRVSGDGVNRDALDAVASDERSFSMKMAWEQLERGHTKLALDQAFAAMQDASDPATLADIGEFAAAAETKGGRHQLRAQTLRAELNGALMREHRG